MTFRIAPSIVSFVSAFAFVAAANALSIHAYHIGNSVTDTLRYNGVTKLAEQDADVYTFGKHISPGVRLSQTWNYQSNTGQMFEANGFGLYRSALTNHTWDAVTLQPFDSPMLGPSGDLAMVKNFISYATPKSPDAQFYIYQRWPRKVDSGAGLAINYQSKWMQTHNYQTSTAGSDLPNETRGYFQALLNRVNAEKPSALRKDVLMVPVGDVLFEVDRRMRAGQVPGYSNVGQLYTDHIHLNHTGSYIVGLTFHATLFRENPVGSEVPANWNEANLTTTQKKQFQEAVWQVVSTHPFSGVKLGDTNRNGILDEGDATVIAGAFNRRRSGVSSGDANGDGVVNVKDFTLLARAINNLVADAALAASVHPAGARTPVPEPASVSLLALGGALLVRRR